MLKHIVAVVALCFSLACGQASAADAAQEQAMADAIAAMAAQPALEQADIDAFIALAPKVSAAGADQEAIMKAYQESGLAPERIALVGSKISVGVMLGQGLTREQLVSSGQFPEALLPTDGEVELITANMAGLMQALGGE